MSDPLVTVVVPAHDAAATIGEQLDALSAQVDAPPFEVVVVDDASTDETPTIAAAHPVVSAVVRRERNGGAGPARNDGARRARGDVLVFTDADDVVTPRFVAEMHACVEARGGVVGGRYVDFDADLASLAPVGEEPGHFGYLPYASGSALAVPRSVFVEHRGFDHRFRFGQDIELSWRLQVAGHGFSRCDAAVVRYRPRPEGRRSWLQRYARHRYQPLLYRTYRDHGMPRTSTAEAARAWLWLGASLPRLGSPERRGQWLDVSARRSARLVGSVRARALYL